MDIRCPSRHKICMKKHLYAYDSVIKLLRPFFMSIPLVLKEREVSVKSDFIYFKYN